MKLYVGTLPLTMTESDLKTTFAAYGTVESADIVNFEAHGRTEFGSFAKKIDPGFSRRCAFVNMPDDAQALRAVAALDGTITTGGAIEVVEAKKRQVRLHNSNVIAVAASAILGIALLLAGCSSGVGNSALFTGPGGGFGGGGGVGGLGSGPAPVNLGTARNYVILAESEISTTGTTAVIGDIGLSPADAPTYLTGFGLVLDASGTFSTSDPASMVTGRIYAANYTEPTPTNLTKAVNDMHTAYTAAGSPAPDATELGDGNIGGLTIYPGTYKWGTGVLIPTNVTLSGGAFDVWIFQIAEDLTVSSDVQVILTGGARPENVFWAAFGPVTLGTDSQFNGVILSQTSVVMNDRATLKGRALAQTAVTMIANGVTQP